MARSERAPVGSRRGLLAVGAIAISFAAIFFREAEPTDPLLASALRLLLAAVVLAVLARGRLQASDRRIVVAGRLGGLLYAIHFGTWVASLSLTTVAASVTLVTATPLLLAIAAVVAGRDRPHARQWIAIVIALVGASVIGGADANEGSPGSASLGDGPLAGDALALVGAAAMAGYLWLARSLGPSLDAVALGARAAGWGALFLLGAFVVRAAIGVVVWPDARALFWIALAALVPQVIGHTALTRALERATPTEVGLATAAEPVLSTTLAWVWLAERPTTMVLAGCALTLVGVLVGARSAADPASHR